jgi:hypothetical protein
MAISNCYILFLYFYYHSHNPLISCRLRRMHSHRKTAGLHFDIVLLISSN